MRVAFHSNQLGIRGIEVALYDYALYNEELLGNESIIISDRNADMGALPKFESRFKVLLYDDFLKQVPSWIDQHQVDVFYNQKSGQYDGKVVPNAKNVVHSVFQFYQPHGDVYAYISKWLANAMGGPTQPYVPYIVDILKYDHNDDYREFLNIPKDATVFGYYGGPDSFNIDFAKKAVIDVAKSNKNVYFLFMNSIPFCNEPNVLFLEGTTDFEKKIGFINTCDACVHARNGGESFGLTVAEFSSKNKPVITTSYCTVALNDLAHTDMLGSKALLYNSYDELVDILTNFKDIKGSNVDWNAYNQFSPQNVMTQFKTVFL
jgi:glycosyltransferase involved in cell wall biosynthesis